MDRNFQFYWADVNLSFRSVAGVGLNDLLDIIIIAFLIYKILIWVKQTRTWTFLKGFGIIVAFSIFSYVFNLHTTWWILEQSFNVGIIALFIIFQPEIRKALEQIGSSSFSLTGVVSVDESKRVVAEVTKALENMQASRTGALILIEQQANLEDVIQTGIPIDAVVSSQLLENIFMDKTPLHDGAVIISRNRVIAASCILPLTKTEIGKDLGTRHRAAVGASEIYGVPVFIVSEESGRMSFAKDGKLRRKVSPAQIQNLLEESVVREEKSRKFSADTVMAWWKGLRKSGKGS